MNRIVWTWGDSISSSNAQSKALMKCDRKDCVSASWFTNAFGAFAQGTNGWGANWGNSQQEVEQKALQNCSQHSSSCRVMAVVHARNGTIVDNTKSNNNKSNSSQRTSTIFDNESFPKDTCGDQMPTNINKFPVNFYPVYVNFSSENLQLVKNRFCKDAYDMTRKDIGKKAIQVGSFTSYERAEQFSKFLQKKVGSGEVGEPRRVEKPSS